MGILSEASDWSGFSRRQFEIGDVPLDLANLVMPMPKVFKHFIGSSVNSMIDLGCGKGKYAQKLTNEISVNHLVGIDYRKDALMNFNNRFSGGQHKYTALHLDLLDDKNEIGKIGKFNWVSSGGLVEHFYGSSFERLLEIHDELCADDGFVTIEVPNFSGFKYLWFYLFDRVALDIHNIMTMSPIIYNSFFEKRGYKIHYSGYVGLPRVWGVTSLQYMDQRLDMQALNYGIGYLGFQANKLLEGLSKAFPSICKSRDWGMYYIFVAQKIRQ